MQLILPDQAIVGKLDRVSLRVGGGGMHQILFVVEELAFFFLGFCADNADDDRDTRLEVRHRVRVCWLL
jgi:hypothetical protein